MSETGFIVIYVGKQATTSTYGDHRAIPYNIGDRLIVTKVSVSSNTGTTYYAVTDGSATHSLHPQSRTSGAYYDAKLFKRLDEIRAERLEELGI